MLLSQDGKPKLFLEIDYHFPRWGCTVLHHKSRNIKYAKNYNETHPNLPIV